MSTSDDEKRAVRGRPEGGKTDHGKTGHGKTIALAPGEVYCRRVKRPLPLAEHERCPYCFGETDEIRTGEHAKFCDFDPEKDPINFGFPET